MREAEEGRAESAKVKELKDRITILEAEKKTAEKKAIETLVDTAVAAKKITADKKKHFVELGEKVGRESLKETLDCIMSQVKLTDLINHQTKVTDKKFSEMSEAELMELRENDRESYVAMYVKEFGIEPGELN